MGRVRMLPHGNAATSIIGVVRSELLNDNTNLIEAGTFMSYGIDNENRYIVNIATDRINIDAVSTVSYSNGYSIEVKTVYESDDSRQRLNHQLEKEYTVADDYIISGDFVHITDDSHVVKATSPSNINGYAISSGMTNDIIRVKIPK